MIETEIMTDKTELDSSLLDLPLPQLTKTTITSEYWASQHQAQRLNSVDVDLQSFWTYYNKECVRALHNGGRYVALRSHRDVVDCIHKLKSGMLRHDIKEELREKLTAPHDNEDEMLDNSIDLAASLLLMMSFCSFAYGFSGRSHLRWSHGSLESFVAAYFDPGTAHLAKENVKMEKIFTARNLCRIAGLDVVWTDNLVDHLRLTDDDRRVHVFHHASFLHVQQQSAESLLPKGLAEETLQTLALLFPSSDTETRKWFSQLSEAGLDKRAIQCGQLKTDHRQTERFRFWNDRLVVLKQVFDEAQPKSLSQWWYDRRNGVQWYCSLIANVPNTDCHPLIPVVKRYTFWVAVLVLVLTIFFGLVQSVEGALQVFASMKPVHILAALAGVAFAFGTLFCLSSNHAIIWLTAFLFCNLILLFVTVRHIQLQENRRNFKRSKQATLNQRINLHEYYLFVLGSGGHTKEMLMMMDDGYCSFETFHRRYLISSGDTMSQNHVVDYEADLKELCTKEGTQTGSYDTVTVTRARKVHQSLLTTPYTALLSILDIFPALMNPPTNVVGARMRYPTCIFTNGPATGFFVGLAAHLLKLLYVVSETSMHIIYIESWARITTLSLTGKLFYYTGIADVLVQHKEVAEKYNVEYCGELVFNARQET
uniref:UDP-N-acetylglucosamine transferase subunit ALG14 n=1 Tax=Gibberella zeae TaxID=5518 RepID=A0A4E9E631_GIBZA